MATGCATCSNIRAASENGKPFPLAALGDKVIVRPDDPQEKTEGGILIPSKAQESSQFGTVVSVGPAVDAQSTLVTVRVKSRVLFAKYSGTAVELDRQEYRILDAKDLLAVYI